MIFGSMIFGSMIFGSMTLTSVSATFGRHVTNVTANKVMTRSLENMVVTTYRNDEYKVKITGIKSTSDGCIAHTRVNLLVWKELCFWFVLLVVPNCR